MFEGIMNFFKKTKNKEEKVSNSKDAAKERLHLVLMQDRSNVSADFLELMKQEIIEVIKKYIEVDEEAIDVRLTNKENDDGTNGAPALYANIPILNIKNEVRKIEKEQENKKAEETATKEEAVKDQKEETKKEKNKDNKEEAEKEKAKSKEETKSDEEKVESKNEEKLEDKEEAETKKKVKDSSTKEQKVKTEEIETKNEEQSKKNTEDEKDKIKSEN